MTTADEFELPQLRSARLVLRTYQEADRAAFVALNIDAEVRRHMNGPLARPEAEQAVLGPVLKQLVEYTHYSEYGGAPLLGIDGCAIVAHGRSDALAIQNAVRVAREFSQQGLNERMTERLAELTRVVPMGEEA